MAACTATLDQLISALVVERNTKSIYEGLVQISRWARLILMYSLTPNMLRSVPIYNFAGN